MAPPDPPGAMPMPDTTADIAEMLASGFFVGVTSSSSLSAVQTVAAAVSSLSRLILLSSIEQSDTLENHWLKESRIMLQEPLSAILQ